MNTSHPLQPNTATSAPPAPRRLITDAPTRMFHGLFALSFAGGYLTAESEHWRLLHVTLGYGMAGLLVFRLLYGLAGPRQAKLSLLWRKLGAAPAWFRSVRATPSVAGLTGRPAQNLGMAMAIALMLALVVPLTFSGYATYNDWGDAFEDLHEFFANSLLMVVLVHVGLIALLSVLRRQNMARPMLSGRIDGTGPSPVSHNRPWLAGLVLLALLSWGVWQWQTAPQRPLADPDTHQAAGGHAHERDDGDEDQDD